ncbi:helix-turn-helix domain-containing protein [Natronobacterium gregoryi]|uniref:DNA-binding protein n=2 Tax=Natronobacterium gregoryi TaxID=44930 RepID=L0AD83_NATGS|nr:helix-turn-helix domain-containing protein [Natronobacterium gregoryi]AFZ71806.1 putative DNA binding protein [Natronobacterium gregoryi SP2]ELY72963.1 DNA binding protein [Natronobacterium gregoryi SP2]PLK21013.1 DNA-binding protein [Natronobacterium gregoryi SP2]SFI87393.1 HTH DNA binding domain-containing protein [Natronobacterium gregoryi]
MSATGVDRQFKLTLSWTEPGVGHDILECLATAIGEDAVSIDAAVGAGEVGTAPRQLSIDVGPVTRKQLEAARVAVEAGYYDTPRQARLADLGTELDISESAVSQRLANVERALMVALAEADDGERR